MQVVNTSTEASRLRFLVLSASLRSGSFNTKLAELAAKTITVQGGKVDFASMREFDTPSYDGDVESEDGIPAGAHEFKRRLEASDAFVISSPEYNFSVPGFLKNAIDWVSRFKEQPFNGRHGMLMSAGPSMVGGNRGLWTLRTPLEFLGSPLYPGMFSLAQAHQGFDADGELSDPILKERFVDGIVGFMGSVEAAKHYPLVRGSFGESLPEELAAVS